MYVEFIRNIPPVPFLFLFYFFISSQVIPHLGLRENVELWHHRRSSFETLFGPANLIENFLSGVLSLALRQLPTLLKSSEQASNLFQKPNRSGSNHRPFVVEDHALRGFAASYPESDPSVGWSVYHFD